MQKKPLHTVLQGEGCQDREVKVTQNDGVWWYEIESIRTPQTYHITWEILGEVRVPTKRDRKMKIQFGMQLWTRNKVRLK